MNNNKLTLLFKYKDVFKDFSEIINFIDNLSFILIFRFIAFNIININLKSNSVKDKLLNQYDLIYLYFNEEDKKLMGKELYNKIIKDSFCKFSEIENNYLFSPIKKDDYYYKAIKIPFIKEKIESHKESNITQLAFENIVFHYVIKQVINNYIEKLNKEIIKYKNTDISKNLEDYYKLINIKKKEYVSDIALSDIILKISIKAEIFNISALIENINDISFVTDINTDMNINVNNLEYAKYMKHIELIETFYNYYVTKNICIKRYGLYTEEYINITNYKKKIMLKLINELQGSK